MKIKIIFLALGASALLAPLAAAAEERPMGFFVSSVGIGNGGDLGGLAGADAHCQKLAAAAGGGRLPWNSAHPSRGCSQDAIKSTGGAGKLYGFAAD